MSTDKEIRELFGKHNLPLRQNDVWSVQGNPVVKHKALERLAAALKIKFDEPRVLRAERDEAVMLVVGHAAHNGASEWSVGECVVNVNYKVKGNMAAYPWAMAEKRAKDRVILKLAGLVGTYSEDEADAFKNGNGDADQDASPTNLLETIIAEPTKDEVALYESVEALLTGSKTVAELDHRIALSEKQIAALTESQRADLRRVYAFKKKALETFSRGVAA